MVTYTRGGTTEMSAGEMIISHEEHETVLQAASEMARRVVEARGRDELAGAVPPEPSGHGEESEPRRPKTAPLGWFP
jgi:hypothetical protein